MHNHHIHIISLQLRGRIVTLGAVQDAPLVAHMDAGLHERRNSNRDMRLSPATLMLFTLPLLLMLANNLSPPKLLLVLWHGINQCTATRAPTLRPSEMRQP